MSESDVDPRMATETPSPSPSAIPDTVWAWCCPNCGSYAGSSNMPDLASAMNRRTAMQNTADEDPSAWGQVTGPRSICQECKQRRGVEVERVRTEFMRRGLLEEAIEAAYQREEKTGGAKLARRT